MNSLVCSGPQGNKVPGLIPNRLDRFVQFHIEIVRASANTTLCLGSGDSVQVLMFFHTFLHSPVTATELQQRGFNGYH